MSFQSPQLLLGLLGVLVLGGLYLLLQRRRQKYTVRFTDVALLQSVVPRRPRVRRHIPTALFLLGAAALVTAMAQPSLNLEVARNDASVMLVIDTSGSMDATDVSPTRMEAARTAAHKLVNQLPSGARVGLVSFSTYPVLAAPVTDNRDSVQAAIDGLQANGGTATGDALTLALDKLTPEVKTTNGGRAPAMIVLLTDGVTNRGSDPLAAASQAKAAGLPIVTVGVGTHDPSVRVHGQTVGGVDEAALSSIAETTGGKYYYAEGAGQLNQIYSSLGTQFGWRFMKVDITVPVVIAGALVLLSGAILSMVWFRVLP
jgi:Ca-activated chloride channel family protein